MSVTTKLSLNTCIWTPKDKYFGSPENYRLTNETILKIYTNAIINNKNIKRTVCMLLSPFALELFHSRYLTLIYYTSMINSPYKKRKTNLHCKVSELRRYILASCNQAVNKFSGKSSLLLYN